MFFSSKITADYIELINGYLDNLPVKEPDDFNRIKTILQQVLDSQEIQTDKLELKEKALSIKELIDNPDWYVESRENDKTYQSILRKRLQSKIQEFGRMTLGDKNFYIIQQTEQKKAIEQALVKNQHKKAPSSNDRRHTLSEQRWHAYQQHSFHILENLYGFVNLEEFLELNESKQSIILSRQRAVQFLMNNEIAFSVISGLDKDKLEFILKHENSIKNLMNYRVSFITLSSFQMQKMQCILSKSYEICTWLRLGASFDLIASLETEIIEELTLSYYEKATLLTLGLSFDLILNLDTYWNNLLGNHVETIRALAKIEISCQELVVLPFSTCEFVICYYRQIIDLVPAVLSFKEFIKLNDFEKIYYVEHSKALKALVNIGIPLFSILKLKEPIKSYILKRYTQVLYLLNEEIPFYKLIQLPLTAIEKILSIDHETIYWLKEADISLSLTDILILHENMFKEIIENAYALRELILHGGLNFNEFLNFPRALCLYILNNHINFTHLLASGVSINEILELDSEVRQLVLNPEYNLSTLIQKDINFQTIVQLEEVTRYQVITCAAGLSRLIEQKIPFQYILELSDGKRLFVLMHAYEIAILIKNGLSFDGLLNLDPVFLAYVISKYKRICYFMKKGISFNEIISQNPAILKKILCLSVKTLTTLSKFGISFYILKDLKPEVINLLKDHIYSLEESWTLLMQMNISVHQLNQFPIFFVKDILCSAEAILKLLKKGVNFEEIEKLDNHLRKDVLTNAKHIKNLIVKGFNFYELITIEDPLRSEIFTNGTSIAKLLEIHFSLSTIFHIEFPIRSIIFKYTEAFITVLSKGFSLDVLIQKKPKQLEHILKVVTEQALFLEEDAELNWIWSQLKK